MSVYLYLLYSLELLQMCSVNADTTVYSTNYQLMDVLTNNDVVNILLLLGKYPHLNSSLR